MTRRMAITHPTVSHHQSTNKSRSVVLGLTLALLFQVFAVAPSNAQEADPSAAEEAAALVDERDPEAWPRVVEEDAYLIKIYPPQFDDWDGSQIEAQAVIEIAEQGKEGSTYGVVNFIARTRVDKDARLVVFDDYQSISANVPAQSELESKLARLKQESESRVDVLNEQSDLYAAKRDYARARYTYVLRGLELKLAAGVLKEEDLREINSLLDNG